MPLRVEYRKVNAPLKLHGAVRSVTETPSSSPAITGAFSSISLNLQHYGEATGSLLQDYAYRAFVRPRTGTPYDGVVPSNLTGIKLAVLRLRNGSLKSRGFHGFKEFEIPTGIVVQPYVKRLAFVYQNLGVRSSFYYPLLGFSYLSPVLGLLAYNAANISAINLPELDIMATKSPISIEFTDVKPAPSGFTAKCVKFDLNGSAVFTDLVSGTVCSTFLQGHFAIVVNSSEILPSPSPSPSGIPSL
ncbi:hypothetical protein KSP40_PGU010653 [Platanthera guangdongensis]|uniref:Uncharacterized protein n=1 Tax=Platanthera guangdongensis TaxID=2320717 RepID=A0ABR2LUD9_9ASPA